jgi:hypothetical protein
MRLSSELGAPAHTGAKEGGPGFHGTIGSDGFSECFWLDSYR